MARALCITNPLAGRTQAQVALAIERVFKRAGWNLEIVTTEGRADARRFAEQGLASGVDQIVVYGGDGTAMQAAAALVGTDVPMGLVAGGTGNILAGNLRLPRRPTTAAETLVRCRTRRIDVGRVGRVDNTHYFSVVAGVGFDARMMRDTSIGAKRRWGMLAYLATAFHAALSLRSVPHCITVDGQSIDTDAAMVLIANCPEIVPRWFPFPDNVQFDDGWFNLVIVHADSMVSGVRAIWELWRAQPAARPGIRRLRGSTVEVRTAEPMPAQLDGEFVGNTPLVTTIVPRGLAVVVP